jgi:hypothetical protein
LIPAGKGLRSFQVTNDAGVLTIQVKQGATQKSLPPMDTRLLQNTSIRVNIRTGNNQDKVFRIDQYQQIQADDGPLVDLFGGKIPLQAGDVSITYETTSTTTARRSGKMVARFAHGWLLAELELADGQRGQVVLDTAATTSVISRRVLSEQAEIRPVESVEFSEGDIKRQTAAMAAATGDVASQTLLGKTTLQAVTCGGLQIDQHEFNVLSEFPQELTDLGIIGIIGLDWLAAGERLQINQTAADNYELILGGDFSQLPLEESVQLQSAFGLWFVPVTIAGQPASLLLDTGARYSLLHANHNRPLSFIGKPLQEAQQVAGLGGQQSKMDRFEFESLQLRELHLRPWQALVGDVKIFDSLGIKTVDGICGMNVLRQANRLAIDFKKQKLWLDPIRE